MLRTLGGIFAACVVSGLLMYGAVKLFPVLPPMVHMLDQPRLNPQKADSFFKDGHGMQLPVAGTVARGYLPIGVTSQEEAAALVNPLPRTKEVFALGRESFRRPLRGVPRRRWPTASAASRPPTEPSRRISRPSSSWTTPTGRSTGSIVMGKNAMPSHAADLSETQRWAVVHYVRALQRAQNAKDEDLKVEGQR